MVNRGFVRVILVLVVVMALIFSVFSCKTGKEKLFYRKNLSDGWHISSDSTEAEKLGGTNVFNAKVPGTVLANLTKAGVYKDVFVDMNIKNIPSGDFEKPWWYVTSFYLEKIPQNIQLFFEGINYKADIWVNNRLIAGSSSAKNPFRMFKFDITGIVKKGKNRISVKVYPPVAGDFSIGFVDWNPAPPDKNMGLFRPVYLEANGGVEVFNPYVVSKLSGTLDRAMLTASVEVKNHLKHGVSGQLIFDFEGKKIKRRVELRAGETKKVVFGYPDYDELTVENPVLWWPHTIGSPFLYKASFEFCGNGRVYDEKGVKFGIRSVSDYFTKEGHRGFKINGKKILIRGGGWVDRLLLDDDYESIKSQFEYIKSMGLNTIRLEGFWGNNQDLYDIADSMGVLIMAGWSCQWEWEDYLGKYCDENYGGVLSDNDIDMISRAWRDQIVWLRNHPSVVAWFGGSDCKAKPELEKRYFETFSEYDTTRIYLASAKEWSSLAGATGVKMRGPYAYEPPVYWYADTLYGGAFGFNTETGPGAQVPPLESIKKMISPGHLWPVDSVWNFHCGRNEFNTLDRYITAMEKRYGKPVSVEDFAKKAQLLNYELMRPMFEAFSVNRYKATGVIQWMLNSAWPEMYWQLYDYYLMPNGAFYGTKKALQPYHAVYDYSTHTIYAVNDKLHDLNNCTLSVRAYDINSQKRFEKSLKINLKANSSREILKLPPFDWNKNVCFLDLRLTNSNGTVVDNNFYWLSYKEDVLDYDAVVKPWNYYTPSKRYADFTALNRMPRAGVEHSVKIVDKDGKKYFEITLHNKSDVIAFFIHAALIDKNTGKTILPVLWSDNYISLLPHETRELTVTTDKKYLAGKDVKLIVESYN